MNDNQDGDNDVDEWEPQFIFTFLFPIAFIIVELYLLLGPPGGAVHGDLTLAYALTLPSSLLFIWSPNPPIILISFGAIIQYIILGFALDILPLYLDRRKRIADAKRKSENRCPNCEYDLTGNESGQCPECGEKLKDNDNTVLNNDEDKQTSDGE